MNPNKTVAFHTLGCKLNYSETSAIARTFKSKGYAEVDFKDHADVYVINTCSVTENADKECRYIVNTALRNSPDAFIAIIGCYAQLKPNEIANIEGVDLVLGATEKFKLINYLDDLQKKQYAEIHSCEVSDADLFVDSYSLGSGRTRAFLKVQDGCDYTCSYCTIPLARGASRSASVASVVGNAKKIAAEGAKEIVLTGVNIGDFGIHLNNGHADRKENFLELIKELDKVEGIERFRISSIEPNLLKDEIIEFVASSKRFVPHFHIPLQSGSNKLLKLMRRRYMRELYAERVNKIKSIMPDCCIGVDVIVGFPGETETDFLETYNFLNELNVSYLHVFTYSERDNTDAVKLDGVVPVAERKKRNKMLRILSAKKLRQFYEENLNATQIVLFERESKNGFMHGFTKNYVKVTTPFNEQLVNQLVPVKLTDIGSDGNIIIELFEESIVNT
ncbi:MAG: tRNA (N(6)-L-threonylcarbamoyladenosine(37)-C(2))-methylthiotransferase MtaB [Bacteroidetes bacterium]|nr:tRNA (N(6)-L-threonylcarbamoyladenosine(37)-C(2))-methylthiotransferase MtaB [Bacteroidota bacterium]